MSLFSELRRRNVFRAAALYAAGAWLLVQVATQVFPFFHIAEWVVRWIVVAAAIGFPVVMVSVLPMLGEPERLFADCEHDPTRLSDAYLNFLWHPDLLSRKARQSPAFQDFAKRIGMVDYWKQNRWPDLCSPTPEGGPDSFTCR
jgi:hypothetical protein